MDDLEKIFRFVIELDKLKSVLRKTKPVGLDRYENTAEHSWQICLLATILAGCAQPPVNATRVVELLLVHDISEIDAGDQIVYAGASSERKARELAAAHRIFGLLPEVQARMLLERWEEFEARQTGEAKFAYAIDRLMPVLHNLYNQGQSWRENSVPLEKILAVNSVIGDACPAAWEQVKRKLLDLDASGFFAKTNHQ